MCTHCSQSPTCNISQHVQHLQSTFIRFNQTHHHTPPIFGNAAAQEMADQEKQLLLEALEEKQKQREQEAQLQEKMLQQLKASGACVGSWVKHHGGYRTIKYIKIQQSFLQAISGTLCGGVSSSVPHKS